MSPPPYSYVSRSGSPPETFHYKPGAGQVFSQPTVTWSPCNIQQPQIQVQTSINTSGQWTTRIADNSPGTEGDIIPVVIVCEAEEGDGMSDLRLLLSSDSFKLKI